VTRRAVTSTAVVIPGPAGQLEGALDATGAAPEAVAVICHPHPLQQGTMHNKVATTLARTFANLGAVSVRFNFRGVGASTGTHADGVGERDDVLAVVDWCRSQWPGLRVYLGGFSFGGAMALAVAARARAAGLVTVAPPVSRLRDDFTAPGCPWLLVHGSADDVVPAAPVLAWAESLPAPPHVVLLDGVGHFFHGKLNALGDAVSDFFAAHFASVDQ
jgi:alpha/beta superfamily hydrolase